LARVLVVDDEDANRIVVGKILRQAGHLVQDATNGAEALALLQSDTYELLVTDMYMPVMDGLELVSKCREISPGLPIVAMSGGDETGGIHRLADAGLMGAVETVPKPFHVEDMLGAVARALSGRL
jgi:CheY-like chemotaxis protein